jgi:hypothetical protein
MFRRTLDLMILLSALAAAQSGWTRVQGTGYARFSVSTLGSSSFYTPFGNEISSAKYRDVTASFYGEYGMSDDWTAVVNFPFLRNHRLETTGSLTAVGDANVGFRRRLLRGRTPVALAVDFGLPIGDSQGIVPVKDLPDSDFRLPTGDGEFNTRVSLYASRSFHEGKTLVSGGGGYNIRSRGYTDELSYSVNGGYRLFSRLWISGSLMGLEPARTPNLERAVGFGVGEGVAFLGLGGEAQYRVTKRYGVSAGYYKPLRGKNLLAGGNLVFGLGVTF